MNNWTLLQMLGGVSGQREIFEEICRKIIKAEQPESWSPREHKGDHGIDILTGDSESGVDVYQVKFFRDQIGAAQQSQIRESYDRILQIEDRVKSWTLMVRVKELLLEIVEEALEELADLDPGELMDRSVLNIAPEKTIEAEESE